MDFDIKIAVLGKPELVSKASFHTPDQFLVSEVATPDWLPNLVITDLHNKNVIQQIEPLMRLPRLTRPELLVITDDADQAVLAAAINLGARAYLPAEALSTFSSLPNHIMALLLAQSIRTRWLAQCFREIISEEFESDELTFSDLGLFRSMIHQIYPRLIYLYADMGQGAGIYNCSQPTPIPEEFIARLTALTPSKSRGPGNRCDLFLARHGRYCFKLSFNEEYDEACDPMYDALEAYVPRALYETLEQLKLAQVARVSGNLESFGAACYYLKEEMARLKERLDSPGNEASVGKELSQLRGSLSKRAKYCDDILAQGSQEIKAEDLSDLTFAGVWNSVVEPPIPPIGVLNNQMTEPLPAVQALRTVVTEIFKLFRLIAHGANREPKVGITPHHTEKDWIMRIADYGPRVPTLDRLNWFTSFAYEDNGLYLFEASKELSKAGGGVYDVTVKHGAGYRNVIELHYPRRSQWRDGIYVDNVVADWP